MWPDEEMDLSNSHQWLYNYLVRTLKGRHPEDHINLHTKKMRNRDMFHDTKCCL